MNLKIEALKACIFILIGAFICSNLPKPEAPKAAQEQAAKCVATISHHTNKDGSTDDITQFVADMNQKQVITPAALESNHLAFGGYVDNGFKSGVSLGLKLNDYDFSLDSDLKNDHRLTAKKVLLTW